MSHRPSIWIALSVGVHGLLIQLGFWGTASLREKIAPLTTPSKASSNGARVAVSLFDKPKEATTAPIQTLKVIAPTLLTPNSLSTNSLLAPANGAGTQLQPNVYSQIQSAIRAQLTYPHHLQRQGVQGRVVISVQLDSMTNQWSQPKIHSPHKNPQLNRLALEASVMAASIEAAQKKEDSVTPSAMHDTGQSLEVLIPIDFTLAN